MISQITEVSYKGITGYVRENRRSSSLESFILSSNARLGHKAYGNRIGRDVLELAAPGPAWQAIAAEVRRLDSLRRPVLRNPRWNLVTAKETFERRFTKLG